jgi:uncharacterized protein YjiS (DUF1127 family)
MFEQLRTRFSTWRSYRETVRQLTWLDRHLLADAGIERRNIKTCARDAAEGRCP